MYLFFIYIQKGVSPDRENDELFEKVVCNYYKVAEYVNNLNNGSSGYKYYFIRKSAYIDTDTITVIEK